MAAYFTLTNSDSSLSKKFRAVAPTYKPIREKTNTINKTLDSGLDVSMGGIYRRHEYLVRVREQEYDDDYGTLADLITFYEYINPNGSPSNVITMTTHLGEVWSVYMVGNFEEAAVGCMIEGTEAIYLIQCAFLFIEQVMS